MSHHVEFISSEMNTKAKSSELDFFTSLKPLHNIGKTKKQKCSQIYT